METIEERLNKIEERNKRVEIDKAWETSFVRILSISIITYIITIVLMYSIGIAKPYLNAFLPVFGFILSTQSIPVIKKYWIKNK